MLVLLIFQTVSSGFWIHPLILGFFYTQMKHISRLVPPHCTNTVPGASSVGSNSLHSYPIMLAVVFPKVRASVVPGYTSSSAHKGLDVVFNYRQRRDCESLCWVFDLTLKIIFLASVLCLEYWPQLYDLSQVFKIQLPFNKIYYNSKTKQTHFRYFLLLASYINK